jgi:hypothetical protein
MSTNTPTRHELEESLERAAAGKRDPEKMRKAIAVELIRDVRDQ